MSDKLERVKELAREVLEDSLLDTEHKKLVLEEFLKVAANHFSNRQLDAGQVDEYFDCILIITSAMKKLEKGTND